MNVQHQGIEGKTRPPKIPDEAGAKEFGQKCV